MKIKSVTMKSVLRHDDTTINFPKRGLVLVTGRNGSGKTTIIEAVALGLWGETLRGTTPWSGDTGSVAVQTYGDLAVLRTKKKTKTILEITNNGATQSFTRMTDGQKALQQVIGPYDIWRRAHVFATQDADRFTSAADAVRKRMLEDILGLDRFEAASRACREDKKRADAAAERAERSLLVTKERQSGIRARLADAEKSLERVEETADVQELEEKIKKNEDRLKKHNDALRVMRKDLKEADLRVWEAEQAERHAKEHAHAISESRCSQCGQAISEETAAAAEAVLKEAREDLKRVREEAKQLREGVQAQISEIEEKIQRLNAQYGTAVAELRRAKDEKARREEAEEVRKELAKEVLDHEDALEAAEGEAVAARLEKAELDVVDRVLSTQGVRAHLLGAALSSIEEVANTWLQRVASIDGMPLQLHLSPYSERGDGSLKDAIALEIEGAGNGLGYRAASRGEQRRIDVALMLALAELSEAANGISGGTLFFDEVFDALDDVGVDAVHDVIAELANDRCVVIITHNQSLLSKLRGTMVRHWHVEAGEIDQRK